MLENFFLYEYKLGRKAQKKTHNISDAFRLKSVTWFQMFLNEDHSFAKRKEALIETDSRRTNRDISN